MMVETLLTTTKFIRVENDQINSGILSEYNLVRPVDKRDKICHAPFKTLLFTPAGNAMACHYNRGLVLGQYPNNSIKEIWFGEKIKKLRNYLSNNDLSYGCQNCKNDLETKRFHLSGCWRHDYLGESDQGYPVLIDLQIDNTCNLECVMCSGEYSSLIRKNREKKLPYTNPYDSNFVKQLEEFIPHLEGINLTGGEPFLINLYYEVLDRIIAIKPEIQIYIHSNGTILNKKIKTYLEKLNFNFTISVDSISQSTYENIRINAKHDIVMQNINYFHQYSLEKNSSFHIKNCLMKNNIMELPFFLEFFNNQNISVQLKPVWFPSKFSLRTLHPNKLYHIIDVLKRSCFKDNTHFQKLNINRYNEVINQLELWATESLETNKSNSSSEKTLTPIFFEKIDKLIENDNTLSAIEKKKKTLYCRKMGEKMLDSIQESKTREKALSNFMKMPIEFIVAEMTRGNIEMLNARFLQEV